MRLKLLIGTIAAVLVLGIAGYIGLERKASAPEKGGELILKQDEVTESDIAVLPLEITMKPIDYKDGSISVVIDNQSGSDYYYGKEYFLQKKVDGEWVDMEPEEEYGWPKISEMLKDTEKVTEEYDLSVFGTLEAGDYKLVKNDLEAEFTLIEK